MIFSEKESGNRQQSVALNTSYSAKFDDKEFARYYEKRIKPILDELEIMRRNLIRRQCQWMIFTVIVSTVTGLFFLFGLLDIDDKNDQVLPGICQYLAAGSFFIPFIIYYLKINAKIPQVICDFFKDIQLVKLNLNEGYSHLEKYSCLETVYDFFTDIKLSSSIRKIRQDNLKKYRNIAAGLKDVKYQDPPEIKRIKDAALHLYNTKEIFFDDAFSGIHHRYPFILAETRIYRKPNCQDNMFKGLVLGIPGEHLFPDETIVCKAGIKPTDNKFRQVHLEDTMFEDIFDVFGIDQIASRRLLTPRMMELVRTAAGRINYKDKPQFMYLNEGFFIFITDKKNRFQTKGLHLWTSVYKNTSIKKLLDDFIIMPDLIEKLENEKILPEKAKL